MAVDKIRTEVDFINKLNEIGELFGIRFKLSGKEVYVIDANDETIKMKNNGNHFSVTVDGKNICMSYIFAEHCFSTSVLIEVFVSDGKKRDCIRLEQELRPESGLAEYPRFMINSYHDGETHLFYSNSFLVETAITNGMNRHIFKAMNKYENGGNLRSLDRLSARFAKPKITRFLCGVDDGEGQIYPRAEFEVFRGLKGHHYKLWVLAGNCKIYQDITSVYKYDPEGENAMIPFFTRDYKGEVQYLEELDNLTPEAWNNLLLSIAQNQGAISCFEDTLEYYNKLPFGEYILNHYSEIIAATRLGQGGSVTPDKPFGKVLMNSIPAIND